MGNRRESRALVALADTSRRWTEDDARRVLAAWARSEETVGAFARHHGLPVHRVYWWHRRLGVDRLAHTESTSGTPTERAFVPVILRPVVSSGAPAPITVVVDGVRVEVAERDHVSAAWVAALVRALGEVSS